ncbi:class I SAM-dependent methyltransferase [Chloroflexota bacterium]
MLNPSEAREGLRVARETAKQAEMVEMDIRQGLPFSEESFQVIVANLSLHYFRWGRTQMVLREVRRRLKAGGHLLARVNSTNDNQYGAASGQLVERNCRIVNGVLKRYFDEEDIGELFRDGWDVRGLEEQMVHRYGRPKVLWEIVAQKT